MELLNVTIANNRKDSSTKGSGLNTGPSVNITAKNVLFDDNMANTGFVDPANCGAKSGGFAINTQGGNVSSDETCDLNVLGSDQENATINLIALADNGGLTLTHALPDPLDAASAAVDKALNAGCPNNDQRGNIRPFTINGAQTLCYVNINQLLGFEIGDLNSGKKLLPNVLKKNKLTPKIKTQIPITVLGIFSTCFINHP